MVHLRYRPPVALRVLFALVGLAVIGSNTAIMLSDRAPGVLRRLSAGFADRLSERLDTTAPRRLATDPRLPDSDLLVHIGLWAVAVILVGWALWTWAGLAIGASGVLALSFVVEVAQERMTSTRVFDPPDLVANTIGVALGTIVVAASYVAWNAVGHLGARERPGR